MTLENYGKYVSDGSHLEVGIVVVHSHVIIASRRVYQGDAVQIQPVLEAADISKACKVRRCWQAARLQEDRSSLNMKAWRWNKSREVSWNKTIACLC